MGLYNLPNTITVRRSLFNTDLSNNRKILHCISVDGKSSYDNGLTFVEVPRFVNY